MIEPALPTTAFDEGTIAVSIETSRAPVLGRRTRRTADLAGLFGLPLHAVPYSIATGKEVLLAPGRVVLVTGPSGVGKSATLERISQQVADARRLDQVAFEPGLSIIDQVAPWSTMDDAIGLLTACGLGDAHLWLRTYDSLSDGERFRASLARSIALLGSRGGMGPLLCDEFGSLLHERATRALCFNLRKLVSRRKFCLVVASNSAGIASDLRPDVVVRLDPARGCDIEVAGPRSPMVFSLRRRLVIEPGGKRDYEAFAKMHYRATDELGFVDKVFVLRERRRGDALGIVVYSHPSIENAMRNRATGGRFSRQPNELNRCVRVLRRLVIHPDVRGCGLGALLVRKTLPLVGTEYVECLASMGAYSPVFQKAGMSRVGMYELQPSRQRAVEDLRALGIDPLAPDFDDKVARQRRVRGIVAQVIREWYATTTAGGERRVDRQSASFLAQAFRGLVGSRPVYFLWHRDPARRRRGRGCPRTTASRGQDRALTASSPRDPRDSAHGDPLIVDRTDKTPPPTRASSREAATSRRSTSRSGNHPAHKRVRPTRVRPSARRDARHDPRGPATDGGSARSGDDPQT